jgi:class 3 adenylate cyclase/TolB-like protein
MSSQVQQDTSSARRLAAIMFTDIVGYTILMGDDERRAMELVRKNKAIQKPLIEKHRGIWLKEMGDGTMASFPTASDAIHCALEIQEHLNREYELPVRIGIHLGEILSEGGDIYGDGVNIAARLQAIADPGGIYISDPVQKSVKSQSDIQTVYLGEMKLKNVDYPIRTYALRGEGLPRPREVLKKKLSGKLWAEILERNVHRVGFTYLALSVIIFSILATIPALKSFGSIIYLVLAVGFPVALTLAWNFERSPKGFVRITSKQSWENPFSGTQKKPLTGNGAIIGLLVIILLINAFQYLPLIPNNKKESHGRRLAVAVMPFRNDSNDPENIYFCNGLMEDVINQLSHIDGMRVPSLTSMLYYREYPKPYTEIVDELKVSHLLEGSVRKLKDRALMTVTLIDAEQNDQVWSNRYEMDLSVEGVWEVQFEVAQQIINSLKLALSANKASSAESLPTISYEAYDNYLKANDLNRTWDIDENRKAIDLLLQAHALDPSFYLAVAELAQSYGNRAELTGGPWVDSMGFYAQKAFLLDPDHYESLNVMGYYRTLTGDPGSGLQLYAQASESGYLGSNNFRSWCEWLLGNHEAALQWAFQNLENDPNNPIHYIDISNAATALGLFDEAMASDKKALSLNPEFTFAFENIIRCEIFRGDYRSALANVQTALPFYSSLANKLNLWTALAQIKLGNFDMAMQQLEGYIDESVSINMAGHPQLNTYTGMALEAYVLQYKGDSSRAETIFRKVLKEALEELRIGAGAGTFSYYYLRILPLLDPIRHLPEYKKIMSDLKVKTDRMSENVLTKGYFDELMK